MKRAPFKRGEKWLLVAPILAGALVWALVTWREKSKPRLIAAPVQVSKAWQTPNGKIVAVGLPAAKRGQIVLPEFLVYDAQSGELQTRAAQTIQTYYSSISPDGKWLATSEWDGTTRGPIAFEMRDVNAGFSVTRRVELPLSDARWLSNAQFTVSNRGTRGQNPHLLPIYNAQTLAIERTLDARRVWKDARSITQIALAPDGKWAALRASGSVLAKVPSPYSRTAREISSDNRLAVVSYPDLRVVARLPGDNFRALCWARDGKSLWALATLEGNYQTLRADIAHFDMGTRRATWTRLEAESKNYILNSYSAAFSPDGRFLVAQTNNADWKMWNTRTGKIAGEIPALDLPKDSTYRPDPLPQFSSDGRTFLRPRPEGIELWDMNRFVDETPAS